VRDHPTALKRWLAAVRIVTGGVFVYMASGHLLGGWATADGFQRAIAGFAKTDPLQPYTAVMVPAVLAAPGFFGRCSSSACWPPGSGPCLGFLWTGAWRPYSPDSILFADRAPGVWRRAPLSPLRVPLQTARVREDPVNVSTDWVLQTIIWGLAATFQSSIRQLVHEAAQACTAQPEVAGRPEAVLARTMHRVGL
jgi:hypothetical protein